MSLGTRCVSRDTRSPKQTVLDTAKFQAYPGAVKDQMTLAEIAEASGLPGRTIRFYIARGLLNGPAKSGRGAVYTAGHLERLEEIKRLQASGQTLSDIALTLSSPEESAAPPPTPWWQHAIADDVVVWVRVNASPWRTKQIRAAVDELARRLQPPTTGPGKE